MPVGAGEHRSKDIVMIETGSLSIRHVYIHTRLFLVTTTLKQQEHMP